MRLAVACVPREPEGEAKRPRQADRGGHERRQRGHHPEQQRPAGSLGDAANVRASPSNACAGAALPHTTSASRRDGRQCGSE